MTKVIKISEDYTRYPGGRFPADGEGNATDFRKMLVPYLQRKEPLIVDLDGTVGFAASFLDEAFGGLVRVEGFSPEEVLQLIEFRATQTHLVALLTFIKKYIKRAKFGEPIR